MTLCRNTPNLMCTELVVLQTIFVCTYYYVPNSDRVPSLVSDKRGDIISMDRVQNLQKNKQ